MQATMGGMSMHIKGLVAGSILAGLVGCSAQPPVGSDTAAVRRPPPQVPQPANTMATSGRNGRIAFIILMYCT